MSLVFNNVWLHVILSTGDRRALASPQVKEKVHVFMKKQLEDLGCAVSAINGSANQVHCLFLLNLDRSADEIVEKVKANTSNFINDQKLLADGFDWLQEYAVFSVTKTDFDDIEKYITGQKQAELEGKRSGVKKSGADPIIKLAPPGKEINPRNFSMN